VSDTLQTAIAFREAGFAVHWLKERSKAPAGGDGWQNAPVSTIDTLRASYRTGLNLGLRTGEPSHVAGMYAHVFDVDIRLPDLADEAWDEFDRMLPGVRDTLPCVISGSGGESRHLHFLTDRAFHGRKLAVSQGKHRGPDGKYHYDWEIDLFGSGRQVAMPPSIHPDTGIAYRWEREYDLDGLEFGGGPEIDSDVIEALGVAETSVFDVESRPPLEFKPGQLERDLEALPMARWDDRDDWVMIGQALHHQFGGSTEGFDHWMRLSKRSVNFDPKNRGEDNVLREQLRRYRGFGRNRRQPVTMGTILHWNSDARLAGVMAELDDLPDDLESETTPQPAPPSSNDYSEFEDLLDAEPTTSPAAKSDEDVFSIGLEDELDWKSLLAITEKGDIASNLHNLRLIVENDKRTHGVMAFNEFTQEVVQRGAPGVRAPKRKNQAKPFVQLGGTSWHFRDAANGDFWTEDKDNSIRAMIEAPKTQGGYGIKVPDRDLRAAVDIVARKNCFHPVREYLSAQTWDGVDRVENLFIDFLGAPDDAYTRAVGRLLMIAGVARVFEPGCKFDFAVILQGLQGKRKSTFISTLAKNWFSELEGEMTDPRAMVEAMQGSWILEIPELGGFVRADVRHVKAFISRRSDKVRLAYAKRAQEYHRQCVFIGSTNDVTFLKDDTGNRRFWPIICTVDGIDTDRLQGEVDQLWAEALVMYRAMRAAQPKGTLPLYLTDADAQMIAARLQESARVETVDDAITGQVAAWLDMPIISGSVDDDTDANGQPVMRNETCLVELWVECLKRDRGLYNQQAAQMLGRAMTHVGGWAADGRFGNFGPVVGRQRVYDRGGAKGYLSRMVGVETE
jgi:predicted P-loop ATPase